jgi:hypothetical protein
VSMTLSFLLMSLSFTLFISAHTPCSCSCLCPYWYICWFTSPCPCSCWWCSCWRPFLLPLENPGQDPDQFPFYVPVLVSCDVPCYGYANPPPPPYIPVYLFTQGRGGGGGGGGRWPSEKVRGAIIHKRGRKYQHDWLYLQSINSFIHQ